MYWESYGEYAIGTFDSIGYNISKTYRFIIYKKGYTGDVKNIICSSNPATLRYLSDEPFGIKGAELVINLLNIDNLLPLSEFYSDSDDTFRINFGFQDAQTTIDPDTGAVTTRYFIYSLFTGYLIQEDSSEILSDIGHEIQLTFSDGLGLLKNIDFYTASLLSPRNANSLNIKNGFARGVAENQFDSPYIVLYGFTGPIPTITDFLVLLNSPIGSVGFEIIEVRALGSSNYAIYVNKEVLEFPYQQIDYAIIGGTRLISNITSRIKLADCIRICFHSTNLNLNIRYAGNIGAYFGNFIYSKILEDVYIDPRTFFDGNNWDSCYTVLEKLCSSFNFTIFQSGVVDLNNLPFPIRRNINAEWHIVRLPELRYDQNEIEGDSYDGYFNFIDNIEDITKQIDFGDYKDIEYGIEQTIKRPFAYYNLKYDNDIKLDLENFEYTRASTKVRQDSINAFFGTTYKFKYYKALDWSNTYNINTSVPPPSFEIQLLINQTTSEESRYLVLSGTGKDIRFIGTSNFEVQKDDKIKVTIEYCTYVDLNADDYKVAIIRLTRGLTLSQSFDMIDDVNGSDNTQFPNFRTITQEFTVTQDALMSINLNQIDESPLGKVYFKPIQVEVTSSINGAVNSNGHLHSSYKNRQVKNNEELDIHIDDSVRNYFSGTLFLDTVLSSGLRDPTISWSDGESTGRFRLGELISKEIMAISGKPRTKLEGKLLGIIKNGDIICYMQTGYNFLIMNGTYFVFGKAEYNFREDYIDFTMYENWKDGEYISGANGILDDPSIIYTFKYLIK